MLLKLQKSFIRNKHKVKIVRVNSTLLERYYCLGN